MHQNTQTMPEIILEKKSHAILEKWICNFDMRENPSKLVDIRVRGEATSQKKRYSFHFVIAANNTGNRLLGTRQEDGEQKRSWRRNSKNSKNSKNVRFNWTLCPCLSASCRASQHLDAQPSCAWSRHHFWKRFSLRHTDGIVPSACAHCGLCLRDG